MLVEKNPYLLEVHQQKKIFLELMELCTGREDPRRTQK